MIHSAPTPSGTDRGDLFADLATVEKKPVKPFYQQEQFVWTLKWTHIHLFGMSMIFIFVGAITSRTVFIPPHPPLSVRCAKNLHLCRCRIILFETLYRLKRPPSAKGTVRP